MGSHLPHGPYVGLPGGDFHHRSITRSYYVTKRYVICRNLLLHRRFLFFLPYFSRYLPRHCSYCVSQLQCDHMGIRKQTI
jgi:hypothetical protein